MVTLRTDRLFIFLVSRDITICMDMASTSLEKGIIPAFIIAMIHVTLEHNQHSLTGLAYCT
jgi:hypothetical protein